MVAASLLTPLVFGISLAIIGVLLLLITVVVLLLLPLSPVFAYYAERDGMSLKIGNFSIMAIESNKEN